MSRLKPNVAGRKQALIDELVQARAAVLEAALALPPAAADVRFLGVWSAHDIVAHLIGWDLANLQAVDEIRAGQLPAFYAAYDADWRTFNAGLVRQHKRTALAETLAAARESHQALLARLADLPGDEITRDYGVRSPRGRRVTIAMLIGAEAGDEGKHAAQIRAYAAG